MTRDELLGEIHKLDKLLSNLNQDHSDREDTLNIVIREKEEARKELALRYIEEKEKGNEELF